jgi:hypothetical protein
MDERTNEPDAANVAAGVGPADAWPQRAQAHEPGRNGRPAEAAVDACRVPANPAPLNGYPKREVLTRARMESAPDGCGGLAASECAPEPADGRRPGHTVDGESGALLVAGNYGARERAEEPVDRPNGESAADQEVLERSHVPPEPAPTEQTAAEAVSGKPAEGRTRAGAGIAVDDQSLASLKPPDRRLRRGPKIPSIPPL